MNFEDKMIELKKESKKVTEEKLLIKFKKLINEVFKVVIVYKDKEREKYYFEINNEKIEIENSNTLVNLIKEVIYKLKKKLKLKKKGKIAILIEEFEEGLDFSLVVINLSKTILNEKIIKEIDESLLTIIEKVVEIGEEIREEGREGKKVGTWFLIGDYEKLKDYCDQLILNPFKGYLKEERNILKNELKETIKEFAQLDGCFVIDKDGTIISAGTYINIDTSEIKKYPGWGTKHLTASAITKKEDCIAVVISESGGKIKIFKDGKIIYKK